MASSIDTQATLGAIVTEHPKATRELERLGLDYCCGGQRTLADACAQKGIDAEEVADLLAGLDQDEPAADWATMDPFQLLDHILAVHHQYLASEMPRISALAEKVASVHGERHPELLAVRDLYAELRNELEPHMMKEEQVLFPMIRELQEAQDEPQFHCGSLQNPISVMLFEHDRAGELLTEIRRVTNDHTVPEDGCGSYQALYVGLAELERDTHLHIHKENNILFPAVIELEAGLAV